MASKRVDYKAIFCYIYPMFKERELSPENYFIKHPPFRDHDDTMAASRKLIAGYFNKKFDDNRHPIEMRGYRNVFYWLREKGYSKKEAQEIEASIWWDPDLLYKAEPIKGAVEFSEKLNEYKIPFPVVSARKDYPGITPIIFKNMLDSTVAWYAKWMPWVDPDDVHLQKGNEFESYIYKPWILKQLGAGIYFEDSPTFAESVLTYTDNVQVYLLSNQVVASHMGNPRLIHIKGENGKLPNMEQAYEKFFGKMTGSHNIDKSAPE